MAENETPASNVIEALTRVMRDLPAIGKDSKADPKQGGYAYRGIEAITSHTQTLFARHGVIFTPHVLSYEVRDITVNGKPWTDVYEMVEYTVYGPGGREDCIKVGPLLAIGRDNSDKGANKCLTQAYKYALIQALNIADAKDDGDNASVEAEHAAPTGITSKEAGDKLRAHLDGEVDGDVSEHALAVWREAQPKAVNGLIPDAEVDRLLETADQYVADLAAMAPKQEELTDA